jgi:hypothetical protein
LTAKKLAQSYARPQGSAYIAPANLCLICRLKSSAALGSIEIARVTPATEGVLNSDRRFSS